MSINPFPDCDCPLFNTTCFGGSSNDSGITPADIDTLKDYFY